MLGAAFMNDWHCRVCGERTIQRCYCCDSNICPDCAVLVGTEGDSNNAYGYYCCYCWRLVSAAIDVANDTTFDADWAAYYA